MLTAHREQKTFPANRVPFAAVTVKRLAVTAPLAFLLAASVAIIHERTVATDTFLSWNAWGFSEWLVNYAGGFTRRGLAGAVLQRLAGGGSALPELNSLLFAVFASYAAILLALVFLSNRTGPRLAWALPLVPGGPVAMALNGEFFYRKELVFTTLTALLCLLYRMASLLPKGVLHRTGMVAVILLAWISLPLATLHHEAFFFLDALAVSWVMMAAAADLGVRRPAIVAGSFLAAAFAGFALMLYFHGSKAIGAAIWHSLSTIDQNRIAATGNINGTTGGAIGAIGWGMGDVLKLDLGVLGSGLAWYWLFATAVAGLFSVAVFYLDRPDQRSPADPALLPSERAALFVMLGGFSLPLYALGWDWGRWIVSIASLAILLGLALPADRLRAGIPAALVRAFAWLDALFDGAARSRRIMWFVLLLLLGTTFRIPECCMEGSGSPTVVLIKSMLHGGLHR